MFHLGVVFISLYDVTYYIHIHCIWMYVVFCQWNILYSQLSSEHTLYSWLLNKTLAISWEDHFWEQLLSGSYFLSLTHCVLRVRCMSVLLIFVASIITFSFLPEKPQLFLSVIWPGIPPCCRHLVISQWSVSWVRREGNYIRAVMDSENWCGQKMEVPVRSKNTWIRSGAGKIGVHGQKVEYL